MEILLRFIILITLALLGGLLYALTINVMIYTNIIDTSGLYSEVFEDITFKAVIVWVICVVLGICSVFIQKKWRMILLLSPLLAPSIFAFFYTLMIL